MRVGVAELGFCAALQFQCSRNVRFGIEPRALEEVLADSGIPVSGKEQSHICTFALSVILMRTRNGLAQGLFCKRAEGPKATVRDGEVWDNSQAKALAVACGSCLKI